MRSKAPVKIVGPNTNFDVATNTEDRNDIRVRSRHHLGNGSIRFQIVGLIIPYISWRTGL
jgi:hypothetical protein